MRHTLASLSVLLAADAALLAATWTGAGDGVSWSDAANWSNNLPPSADDTVWDIGAGFSVVLDGAAPGDRITKQGEGTLCWSGTASAGFVDVLEGTFDFGTERTVTEITLSGGSVTGWFLESPVCATGGTFSAYLWAPLTLPGGAVVYGDAYAGYGVMMSGATVRGHLIAESGIWIAPGSEPSRIEGLLELSTSSSLSWSMQDSLQVTPLIVTGAVSSIYSEIWLYFGLVDWSQPYWDTQRDYLFVDAQEGGIVSANLVPDPYAGNEPWGAWSRVATSDGDIVMRWTPLADAAYGVATIPESSATPWIMALAGLLMTWRAARGTTGRARHHRATTTGA